MLLAGLSSLIFLPSVHAEEEKKIEELPRVTREFVLPPVEINPTGRGSGTGGGDVRDLLADLAAVRLGGDGSGMSMEPISVSLFKS